MVVTSTTVIELAKPLARVILERPAAEWTVAITKLPIIQKIVSDTEVDKDVLLERLAKINSESPDLVGSAFGMSAMEWCNFTRRFYGAVEKNADGISDPEHVKIEETFQEWKAVKMINGKQWINKSNFIKKVSKINLQ